VDRTLIARTILDQLGGGRFQVMTGAKDFTATSDGLTFRLPGKPGFVKDGITHVRITLTPLDEYTVDFLRARGTSVKTIATVDGVYCDTLRAVFESTTGLRTSL
jgi:hypothetical protein